MKYIITEEQRDRLFVIRRLPELKSLIVNLFPFYHPCDFNSPTQYMMAIKMEMFEAGVLDWFDMIPDKVIWDVVTEFFRELIIDNYTENCKDL